MVRAATFSLIFSGLEMVKGLVKKGVADWEKENARIVRSGRTSRFSQEGGRKGGRTPLPLLFFFIYSFYCLVFIRDVARGVWIFVGRPIHSSFQKK
jgi:hypothetical protein